MRSYSRMRSMRLGTVATDRDVRAPRVMPSLAQVKTRHALRRTASIAALITIDTLSLLLAAVLVAPATGLGWVAPLPVLSWPDYFVACAVLIIVASLKGLYLRRSTRHNISAIVTAWMMAFVITLALSVLVDPKVIGFRYVLVWCLGGACAVAARCLYDALGIRIYGSAGGDPPALVLGSLDSCAAACKTLAELPAAYRLRPIGLVVPEGEQDRGSPTSTDVSIIGDYAQLAQALKASGALEVVIADAEQANGHLGTIISVSRQAGATLKILHALPHDAVTFVPGFDQPLYVVQSAPARPGSYVVKRAGDRIVAAAALVLLSPVLLAIALLIRMTSPGPVLFVQPRVGVGQRVFLCWKFRTMVQGAARLQTSLEQHNDADGALFKMRQDPRVTPIGRVLRRLSLDELPQLFNVLRGEMSLVGPRPLPLRDWELMEEWHRRRHVMLPGITGLWQVSGRSDLSFDDMIRLDLQYLETWSLMSDLHILWRTAGAVIAPRGAY